MVNLGMPVDESGPAPPLNSKSESSFTAVTPEIADPPYPSPAAVNDDSDFGLMSEDPPPTPTPTPTPVITDTAVVSSYYSYDLPNNGIAIYRLEATAGDAAIIVLLGFILTVNLFTVIQRTARASSARSGG